MFYISYIVSYFIILAFILLSATYGAIAMRRNFRDLRSEREKLGYAWEQLKNVSDYKDVSLANRDDPRIVTRWIAVCQSRASRGISTSQDILEGILFDLSGKRDSGIRFAISSLVILGLLGTFAGMTLAVIKASGIIARIRMPDSSLPTETVFGELLTDLSPVLGGMRMAFTTSVMGLFFSLCLGVAFTVYRSFRDSFRIEALAFANEKLLPLFTPVSQLTVGQALEKYSTSMENALQQIRDASEKTFEKYSKSIQESLQTIEKDSTSTFQQVTGKMEVFSQMMAKQVDESVKKNAEIVEKLTNEVGAHNSLLISKVTDTTEKVIESSFSAFKDGLESLYQQVADESRTFRETLGSTLDSQNAELRDVLDSLKSYEDAYIADREQTNSKLQRFLEEATMATTSINERNRELFQQIQERLVSVLNEISNVLGEQLSGLVQRLDRLSVPMDRAASKIEGTQENFVKLSSRVFRDLHEEFKKQHEDTKQQLDTLTQVSQRTEGLISQLAGNTDVQSSEVRVLANSINQLTKDVASLNGGISSLTANSGSISRIVSLIENHVQALESSIRNFAQTSDNMVSKISKLDSLSDSTSAIESHVQKLGASVQDFAERCKDLGLDVPKLDSLNQSVVAISRSVQSLETAARKLDRVVSNIPYRPRRRFTLFWRGDRSLMEEHERKEIDEE